MRLTDRGRTLRDWALILTGLAAFYLGLALLAIAVTHHQSLRLPLATLLVAGAATLATAERVGRRP